MPASTILVELSRYTLGTFANNKKMLLPALLAIFLLFSLTLPASVAGTSATVHLPGDRAINHSAANISSPGSAMVLNTDSVGQGQAAPMVAAGYHHPVGLKADGRVVALGNNYYGRCDVGGWSDIQQVATGAENTVGLKADGRVVALGQNVKGQCDVGDWTDIIQVAAGEVHTLGLKDDGSVVAVGDNTQEQCNVGDWRDIIQVAAGWGHTVGVKADGTVVAVGWKGG